MNDLRLPEQLKMVCKAFTTHFGMPATHAAVAPGRVNLIGEHTDYNDGFVLPIAIDRQTVIVATPNQTNEVRLLSMGLESQPATFAADHSLKPGKPAWSNYVRGVVAGCLTRGMDLSGFDAMIHSTVPLGSGLSSSAALEVATATLIESMTGQTIPPAEKAKLCQQAEHDFAGMPCGIMDQFISAAGREGCAMLLDCQNHETRHVHLNDPTVGILIINSNVKHQLTGSEYPQRRAQCEQAAKALGLPSLREATMVQLLKKKATLDPLVFKRAYHVIGEIERTQRASYLLEASDWESAGRLMFDSHTALRDAFEVSTPELDLLVQLATNLGIQGGVFGSRMTGGGFGGCTVSLIRKNKAPHIIRHLTIEYLKHTGIEATAFLTQPAAGARAISIP